MPVPNPVEMVRKVPWEVWVGLGLTVVIGWIVTRQALSAGQESAMQGVVAAGAGTGPGTDAGTVQALGQYQTEMMQSIAEANRQTLAAIGDLGTTQADIANNQQSILSGLAGLQSGQSSGFSQVNADTAAIASATQTQTRSIIDLGALLTQLQQQVAAIPRAQGPGGGSPTQPSNDGQGSGPGGRNVTQAQANADIGTHSATDASGNTYTISKTYANMTDSEKDDANRFAHGFSG
jgi:hypothetical protein